MNHAWLSIALSVALLSACGKASDGSSKSAGAAAAPSDTLRPHAFRETVEVISPELLRVTIHAEGEVRVRPGGEQEVAKWGGDGWYESSVSERVRSAVREQFQRLPVDQIEPGTLEAAKNARAQLTDALRDTPFELHALSIASVELPKVYVDSMRAREETRKENERLNAELESEKRKIEEQIRRRNEAVDREREEMLKRRGGN